MTTTPGGLLLVLAVLVPFVGVLAGLAFGGRNPQRIALLTIVAGLGIALALGDAWLRSGSSVVYLLGGWAPPLGIALRADAMAVAMMLVIAVVIAGIGIYACADFGTPADQREARAPFTFWLLLMAVWGSLNLVFVSGDLFTLYVALELLTFAGVPLVCLDGRGETLRAALRYLLFALLGSVLYLLGAVLLYGAYGTLDISLLAARIRPEPATWAAAALMTTGLLAKTALFPLHLWLPPAHAGAPAAASAVLSALVVKGSWFLVVRLWFDVMPGVVTLPSAEMLGGLGAMAILLFSVVALRQERLKLLIAYSTLAQIGYLFLMFPLAFDAAAGRMGFGGALTAGMLQAMSHATAKAAMFMAAGSIYAALGHDRIAGLAGIARALPISVLAFARRRRGADGRAAERRLSREKTAARRGRGQRPVVVGRRAAGGRRADHQLCRACPRLRAAPFRRTRRAEKISVARRAMGRARLSRSVRSCSPAQPSDRCRRACCRTRWRCRNSCRCC